jgi:hypothetical protein
LSVVPGLSPAVIVCGSLLSVPRAAAGLFIAWGGYTQRQKEKADMRPILSCILAAALQLPIALYAAPVMVGGWVDRVDGAGATLTVRTFGNPRTIQIEPNAVVRLNGKPVQFDQLPRDSQVTITAEKGPDGTLHAVQIDARGTAESTASYPTNNTITGRLVALNIPENRMTVRTATGDFLVPLGEAPILVNGTRGSSRNLQPGQMVQVDRTLPTEASADYVTNSVRIMPVAAAAGTGAAAKVSSTKPTSARTAVRSRTRGYRRSYTRTRYTRKQYSRTRYRSRQVRRRTRYRYRHRSYRRR